MSNLFTVTPVHINQPELPLACIFELYAPRLSDQFVSCQGSLIDYGNLFDSTLGYPGEGPPKRVGGGGGRQWKEKKERKREKKVRFQPVVRDRKDAVCRYYTSEAGCNRNRCRFIHSDDKESYPPLDDEKAADSDGEYVDPTRPLPGQGNPPPTGEAGGGNPPPVGDGTPAIVEVKVRYRLSPIEIKAIEDRLPVRIVNPPVPHVWAHFDALGECLTRLNGPTLVIWPAYEIPAPPYIPGYGITGVLMYQHYLSDTLKLTVHEEGKEFIIGERDNGVIRLDTYPSALAGQKVVVENHPPPSGFTYQCSFNKFYAYYTIDSGARGQSNILPDEAITHSTLLQELVELYKGRMWTRPLFDDSEDVVIRAMHELCRQREAHNVFIGSSAADEVRAIVARERPALLRARLTHAWQAARGNLDFRGAVWNGVTTWHMSDIIRYTMGPTLQRLRIAENLARTLPGETADLSDTKQLMGVVLGVGIRDVALPAAEEGLKMGLAAALAYSLFKSVPYVARTTCWKAIKTIRDVGVNGRAPTVVAGKSLVRADGTTDWPARLEDFTPEQKYEYYSGLNTIKANMLAGLAFGVFEHWVKGRPYDMQSVTTVAFHAVNGAVKAIFGFAPAVICHTLYNLAVSYKHSKSSSGARKSKAPMTHAYGTGGRPPPSSDGVRLASICLRDSGIPIPKLNKEFRVRGVQEPHCKESFGGRSWFGILDHYATVFRTCPCNERVALNGRVGKELPIDRDPALKAGELRHWRGMTKICNDYLWDALRVAPHKMTHGEWLQGFDSKKRTMYNEVYKAGTYYSLRRNVASSFVKVENAVKPLFTQYKDPRLIQGSPPEFNIHIGPHVKPFAKAFKEAIAPNFDSNDFKDQVVYTAKMTSEQIGHTFKLMLDKLQRACRKGDRVVIVEDDQSRFDMHLREGAFHFLKVNYSHYFPKRVAAALRRNVSYGRTKSGIKYSIPYTMQSGWPDTSLGDTMVNFCMKMNLHGRGRPWISMICGDDSITVTLQSEVDRMGGVKGMKAFYAKCGMEVDIAITSEPLDVGFCSGRFVPTAESYILMPKPFKFLAKICFDRTDRSDSDYIAWLRGIRATCKKYGTYDPIISALASALDQFGAGRTIEDTGMWEEKAVPDGSADPPSRGDILYYYMHHYGWGAKEVEETCGRIRSMTPGTFLSGALVDAAICKDLA